MDPVTEYEVDELCINGLLIRFNITYVLNELDLLTSVCSSSSTLLHKERHK